MNTPPPFGHKSEVCFFKITNTIFKNQNTIKRTPKHLEQLKQKLYVDLFKTLLVIVAACCCCCCLLSWLLLSLLVAAAAVAYITLQTQALRDLYSYRHEGGCFSCRSSKGNRTPMLLLYTHALDAHTCAMHLSNRSITTSSVGALM
jgi:hypothetical protein